MAKTIDELYAPEERAEILNDLKLAGTRFISLSPDEKTQEIVREVFAKQEITSMAKTIDELYSPPERAGILNVLKLMVELPQHCEFEHVLFFGKPRYGMNVCSGRDKEEPNNG